MKYIIKNCPAYRTECEEIFNFLGSEKIFNACLKSAGTSCKDITDCLLKRIVATCKQEINMNDKDAPTNAYAMGRVVVAEKILELLEIEEVDDTN